MIIFRAIRFWKVLFNQSFNTFGPFRSDRMQISLDFCHGTRARFLHGALNVRGGACALPSDPSGRNLHKFTGRVAHSCHCHLDRLSFLTLFPFLNEFAGWSYLMFQNPTLKSIFITKRVIVYLNSGKRKPEISYSIASHFRYQPLSFTTRYLILTNTTQVVEDSKSEMTS